MGSGTCDVGVADWRGALESRRVEEEDRANVEEEEDAIATQISQLPLARKGNEDITIIFGFWFCRLSFFLSNFQVFFVGGF